MIRTLYSFLVLGAVLLSIPNSAQAASPAAVATEFGIGEGKPVTSPAKLNRQLHRLQMQLQAKAKKQARENRRRYQSGAYR